MTESYKSKRESVPKINHHKFLEMAFVADKFVVAFLKEHVKNYLILNAHIVSSKRALNFYALHSCDK